MLPRRPEPGECILTLSLRYAAPIKSKDCTRIFFTNLDLSYYASRISDKLILENGISVFLCRVGRKCLRESGNLVKHFMTFV